MNEEFQKSLKKANKVYIIELLVIAVVIIVLATLKLTGVIGQSQRFRHIFSIITTVGFVWIMTDFILMFMSKRHRKRNSMFDKVSLLPFAIALITLDIICFINWNVETIEFFSIYVSIAFYYAAAIYIVQAIYHIKHPLPSIIAIANEDVKAKMAAKGEEENKPESK